jgi:beta-lactamase regulating signal transducer with metallopeptidase domain
MSDFVATWNSVALDWGLWLVNAAVQSAWVLALVTGLWLLIRKRGSAHLGYALFLLPLVPLAAPSFWSLQLNSPAPTVLRSVLPTQWLESPSTLAANADADADVDANINAVIPGLSGKSSTSTELRSASASPTQTESALPPENTTATVTSTWIAWTFLAWALMTLYMLVLFVKTQILTAKQVGTTSALSARNAKRVCVVLDQLNAPQHIQVLECSGVAGPAAWGLHKPRILFPPNMIEELDDSQLAWVIGHELAHHRRFDLLIGAAQRVLQIAWFFHPLVWWQCRKLDHLRECACDETSQARTQTRGKQCAQALLQVAAQSSLPQNPRFALQTLHNNKQTMKHRIHRLMNTKRTARAGMTPLAIPLLLLAAGISTTTLRFQTDKAVVSPEVIAETGNFTTAPQGAIGMAQAWLISQQQPDGHWPAGPGFEKASGEFTTVGITALVLISLENADPSIAKSRRDKAVQKGLAFLKDSLENASEIYVTSQSFQALASHAVATRAWLGGHRDATDQAWRTTAKKALATLELARNPYGAWGYEFEPSGDANVFNTALALQALATAKEMGFETSRDVAAGAQLFLNTMTNMETGRVGYTHGILGDVRLVAKKESHPALFTDLSTAMSILAHHAMGTEITDSKALALGVSVLASKRPSWNKSSSSVDYYYWYFGSKAMKLVGGEFEKKWQEDLHAALLPRQLGSEGLIGSFPAVDAWSEPKATVHATVMATLALQAAE